MIQATRLSKISAPILKTISANPVKLSTTLARRNYSQVDYKVYKNFAEPFDELNELKKFRKFNRSKNIKWFAICFALGATISYNYSIHEIFQNSFNNHLPTTTTENAAYLKELEDKLNELPIVQELKSSQDYVELKRSWSNFSNLQLPEDATRNETIHETLNNPGSIAIPPLTFYNKDTEEYQTVLHLGQHLTGYPFIVHGGIISLVVDEVFKDNFSHSKEVAISKIHTSNLTVNYALPTLSNNFIVIKSKVNPVTNEIEGSVESTNGAVLTKASASYKNEFVEHGVSQNESANVKKGWFWM